MITASGSLTSPPFYTNIVQTIMLFRNEELKQLLCYVDQQKMNCEAFLCVKIVY